MTNQQMMSGLLDYYNSRSTSFASLVLASIFGLVTLSAIIQSMLTSSFPQGATFQFSNNLIPVGLSLILYILFSFAGFYTIKRYSHYAGIADEIKAAGLEQPFFTELVKIKPCTDNGSNSLIEYIEIINKKDANSWEKRLMHRSLFFPAVFVISLFVLGVIVYWPLIEKLLPAFVGIALNS